jgi:hypothetical protein
LPGNWRVVANIAAIGATELRTLDADKIAARSRLFNERDWRRWTRSMRAPWEVRLRPNWR